MNQDLKKDLAWSLLLGVIFALSPHTGAIRPVVSLVLGTGIAAFVLVLRAVLRRHRPGLFAHNGR